MADLVKFLRARLDKDEQVARDTQPACFAVKVLGLVLVVDNLRHVLRHDPDRVLAEVGAKRWIIDLHSAEPGQHPDFCWHDKHELPCPTLRLLALPYADHPSYDPGWAL